jgi:hypothetical protein
MWLPGGNSIFSIVKHLGMPYVQAEMKRRAPQSMRNSLFFFALVVVISVGVGSVLTRLTGNQDRDGPILRYWEWQVACAVLLLLLCSGFLAGIWRARRLQQAEEDANRNADSQ